MERHSHLNMAHIASPERFAESARIVVDAGSQAVYIVDSAGALLPDDVRRGWRRFERCCPTDVAIGIHEHNNLSLAVANSVAAIEEGATIVDVTLAGMGAGAGNCQMRAAHRGAATGSASRPASISSRSRTRPTTTFAPSCCRGRSSSTA